ncbi:MAG: nucleotidyltransferase domain-containing protein [Peptococcaceae bacterium]|nr:nucleotidyltransferase domain-containing protein [Peptococcaceae bacterium]
MPSPFINFAATRFVNQKKVLDSLRECAGRLIDEVRGVAAVYLFGSFARGNATPRSDADLVVVVEGEDRVLINGLRDAAGSYFISASVPVDVFVLSRKTFEEGRRTGRGVAGAVEREGVLLAARSSAVAVNRD